MPTTRQKSQPRASGPTSSPASMATSGKQNKEEAFVSPADSNHRSNAPLPNADDDFSDAPQPRASHSSSSPSSRLTTGKQDYEQAIASPGASNFLSNAPFSDSDDDLSDVPETPVSSNSQMAPNFPPIAPLSYSDTDLCGTRKTPLFPTSPTTPSIPTNAPPSDSDGDLSEASHSPVWQKSAGPPPSWLFRTKNFTMAPDCPAWFEAPKAPPPPPLCTDPDCPLRRILRRHRQGKYRFEGKPPLTRETEFGESNPPPYVWESLRKIQTMDRRSTIEDDISVLGFSRMHYVESTNTSRDGN